MQWLMKVCLQCHQLAGNIMDTLIFTSSNKNFIYETDQFIIHGSVFIDADIMQSFTGDVRTNDKNSDYIANIRVGKEGDRDTFDVSGVSPEKIDAVVALWKTLYTKLKEEFTVKSEDSESLVKP